MEQNKALMRRMWEGVWTQKRLDLIDEVFAPDIVLHVNGDDKAGREEARKGIGSVWLASFPDLAATVQDQVAEGDKVCDRMVFNGTHTGAPYLGIAASGKRFRFTQTTISRTENGQIAEIWEDFDFFGFLRQLGVKTQRPPAPDQA